MNIVTCRALSRQRLGKHVPAATNTHAAMDLPLETVFSTRSMQRDTRSVGVEYLHPRPASRWN
jgi:hypothetical protein